MELFPGVHRIEVIYQGRYLYQHVLVGEENILIIDSGIVTTPMETIGPYLKQNRLIKNQQLFLLVTHSDADHCGGNARLQSMFPNIVTMSHILEEKNIQNPEINIKNRYAEFREYGVYYNDERYSKIRENLDTENKVDISLHGGECMRLSPNWNIQLLHSPGHTAGHMLVFDAKNKMAIIADAVLGDGVYSIQGELTLCPTYRYTDLYLQTIKEIAELDIDYMLASHFPTIQGKKEINTFLQQSVEFVDRVQSYILEQLKKDGEVTLKSLIDHVQDTLGGWPTEKNIDLCYCLQGGLEHLERKGKLLRIKENKAWRERI